MKMNFVNISKKNVSQRVNKFTAIHFNQLVFGLLFLMLPEIAMAGWIDTLKSWSKEIQVGLYAVGGILALSSLMWVGIRWQISRSNGDMETTAMDYFKQVAVIAIVGSTMILGAAAWQFFGGTGV